MIKMVMVNLFQEDLKLLQFVVVPIVTFILGFVISRFTMSKKERKDYEMQLFTTTQELIEEQQKAFQSFAESIQQFANKTEQPNLDDFFNISTKGELYFNRLNLTCNAIISEKVDKDSMRNSLIPQIRECLDRTLPDFYSTLQEIARKQCISYNGELRRENYESLYIVYEKFVAR